MHRREVLRRLDTHLLAFVGTSSHHAVSEALEVRLRLGFRQLLGVILRCDFHLLADCLRRPVPKALNVDGRDDLSHPCTG